MAFGLKVLNTLGDVVIDGEWPNYTKIEEGTREFSLVYQGGNGDPRLDLSISLETPCTSAAPPILFIVPSGAVRAPVSLVRVGTVGSPGNWRGFVITFTQPYNKPTTSRVLQYRVYGVQPPFSAAWGLRVFSSGGVVTFDSSRVPLIVDRVILTQDWTLVSQTPGTYSNYMSWTQTHKTPLASDTYVSVSTLNYMSGAGDAAILLTVELQWLAGELIMGIMGVFGNAVGYGPALKAQPVFCDR